MKLLSDSNAQAGGVVMFTFGLLLVGFFIVAFGAIMNQFQVTNNELIINPDIKYSQEHKNAMETMFLYWWGLPIYALILFVVWGIKNSLEKEANEL